MDKRTIRATHSSMTDIMILDPIFDVFIDLYRHDPNLLVEVPLDEYSNFILFVLGEKKHMFADSATLKYLVKQSVTSTNADVINALRQNYILDVMSAAGKELHLAEDRGRKATLIRFALPKVQRIFEIDQTIEVTNEKYRLFYRRLELLGYAIPSSFIFTENEQIAKYIDLCVRASLADPSVSFIVRGF